MQIKAKNTFFPASMPYAHLFEDLLLEARQHYSGGTRSENDQATTHEIVDTFSTSELLENVAEEHGDLDATITKTTEKKCRRFSNWTEATQFFIQVDGTLEEISDEWERSRD